MKYNLISLLTFGFFFSAFASDPIPLTGTYSVPPEPSTWIWPTDFTPAASTGDDGQSVNLGLRFRSSENGYIKSIRFWKRVGNNGTHIGTLWSNNGTKLAEVTFSNESASGWQTATFSTPVAINANTTYIASYFCPQGHYSLQSGYFNASSGTGSYNANPPLSAPADGLYGANGIYSYSGSVSFPNQSANSTNYWVDVEFESSATGGSEPPPQPSLGNSTWIWPASITPSAGVGDDGQSLNLGLRFRSAENGFIKSIRFWKRPGNNGTHIGTLWTNTGTKIAEVTFSNESASGWQTATFSTPVAITANTTYVASYFCPLGQYSRQSGYFNSSTGTGTYNTNPPLSAPADGLYGANGIYAYSSSVSFPNQSASSTNYWVDVEFESSSTGGSEPPPPPPPTSGNSTWIWPSSITPSAGVGDDGQSLNLGLRFRSAENGFIKSIRFWKRPGNNGTHIGTLWTNTGTKIAEVTFSNESASGWQTATFSTPVAITANTTYVASYFCPLGQYSRQSGYFNSSTGTGTYNANPPLSAPADGLYGANGIYAYSGSVSFPNQSASSTNYWVDVEFQSSSTGGSEPPPPPPVVNPGTDHNLNLAAIPFSQPDIPSPFRGAESWHYSNPDQIIRHPTETSHAPTHDIYYRSSLSWNELEIGQGIYDWSNINEIFNDAIANKQKVSLGVMTQRPGQSYGPNANGAYMSYPLYLHNLMQSDLENNRDYILPSQNIWIPNYNSNYYLSRFEALLQALASHINNSNFQGVSYKDALGYIDIRGYGSWGEWNMVYVASSLSDYPPGRRPLASSLIRIVDAHKNAFPNNPLVALVASFDGNRYPNIMVPPEVGYHILTTQNNWGKIGWRMDSYGWTDAYLRALLEENTVVHNGMRFDTAILNRYKYAPITGEGPCGGTSNGGPHPFWHIPKQVRLYHTTMIGNGNFCGENFISQSGRDSMRMAWKLSGYRVIIEAGSMTGNLQRNMPFAISLNWKNTGIAPVYENWHINYELHNENDNSIAWSGRSSHQLKWWQPQSNATPVTDNFILPDNIPGGNYRLVIKITDPTGYRHPFPLAMEGRRADGSYLLRSSIFISGTGGQSSPSTLVVNAGTDQVVNLPQTSASLSGQVSIPVGENAVYSWTKIAGPPGDIIQSPTSLNTLVYGMMQGVYIYRLTATLSSSGFSRNDDMVIIVNMPQQSARIGSVTDGQTSISNQGNPSGIQVYPIPVKKGSRIFLKDLSGKTIRIQLVNQVGISLLSTSFRNELGISTDKLPAGFYYLQLMKDGNQEIRKIMVID